MAAAILVESESGVCKDSLSVSWRDGFAPGPRIAVPPTITVPCPINRTFATGIAWAAAIPSTTASYPRTRRAADPHRRELPRVAVARRDGQADLMANPQDERCMRRSPALYNAAPGVGLAAQRTRLRASH